MIVGRIHFSIAERSTTFELRYFPTITCPAYLSSLHGHELSGSTQLDERGCCGQSLNQSLCRFTSILGTILLQGHLRSRRSLDEYVWRLVSHGSRRQ